LAGSTLQDQGETLFVPPFKPVEENRPCLPHQGEGLGREFLAAFLKIVLFRAFSWT
jgi:hypothetical protein